MTLLQTRVEDEAAEAFRQVARQQGKTPYALLAGLVRDASRLKTKGGTWSEHRQWLDSQMDEALPENACLATRKDENR